MKCILGKKLEMTQTWTEKGRVVPITVIEAGPCTVAQIKTKERDGYGAVQFGFGTKKHLTKPMKGHLKELPALRALREFRGDPGELRRGDTLDVSVFSPGDIVKVTGISKGKGFQGVVKRHGFHGHPSTHGHKDQERMPGAIGAGGVQHVRKGQRMAGRMGGERVTVRNLKIVAIDKEKNRLLVKGAVPGARNSLVMIYQ
ncbi:50S ribosomal protein L3 [Candidatus Uhrbacteria bacterium RIFCSPLOWO2_01_FULL_47_24]|uniref:Large ribosomal subunit protein uL3 n=1 Tax=Candidatus Uhrbacteria bacterium RIFCSPLOWO2_01_FULL_47_24 TaxID=1802401 RepID=A0A1F7UV80_9BACT|nr:MAG: 50S ribosomal protein L3 [Candidatus Uhrbacteria bacterium RIFCSPHIGHO2_01_FULL_47_11]OGL68979.1 MAG: 50S ribosomal protein L3 [Candidatus Uhrbacteria bacterium RIFCSPHIGHO2_02_FULL_46_47]OGL74904.1 MAG: 50S ribosomal protein L3 [Candidatus Uhrbacteria bacterium RIFCSPHIGHO2_12_FULL_47_11]OGL81644.1 MAG: 50S ribosomal protein L3 [Candidatus Uhrbacteria bacterium RIFCSPLOWO2_01_FULL_47_24]OGL85103.1 MAG: 50S ribosomal protein L3 [Candidatus Uhrbacteria bacterium RIFCSPLOWO2_02_FULL_46_25